MRTTDQRANAQNTELTDLLHLSSELTTFRNSDGQPFALLPGEDINQCDVVPVRGPDFRSYIYERFHELHDRFPNEGTLRLARDLIDSRCARRTWSGPPVSLRVARGRAEHARLPGDPQVFRDALALDLGRQSPAADDLVLEIDTAGWAVNNYSDFHFLRPRGYHPSPLPVPAGPEALEEFRQLLRIDPSGWNRVLTWLLAAMRPKGPFPILILQGRAGSGKSLAAQLLRAVLDPAEVPLATLPNKPAAVLRHAHRNWIQAYDHVTAMPREISSALCRLSTRAGYTLHENISVNLTRPILLTTPTDEAGAAWKPPADLLERALTVTIPPLTAETRRPDEEIEARFEQARPRILGALAQAASVALRRQPEIQLDAYPTNAAAAIWVIAAGPALNATPEALRQSLEQESEFAVPKDPLPAQIAALMETQKSWQGTATQLIEALKLKMAANQFSRRLKEVEELLQVQGIKLTFSQRSAARKLIQIDKEENHRHIVTPSQNNPFPEHGVIANIVTLPQNNPSPEPGVIANLDSLNPPPTREPSVIANPDNCRQPQPPEPAPQIPGHPVEAVCRISPLSTSGILCPLRHPKGPPMTAEGPRPSESRYHRRRHQRPA